MAEGHTAVSRADYALPDPTVTWVSADRMLRQGAGHANTDGRLHFHQLEGQAKQNYSKTHEDR